MQRDDISRRDFLKLGASLAAALGLARDCTPVLGEGLERLAQAAPRVVWLQGLACAGCSISWLNADRPPVLRAITEQLRLAFHPTLSAAQGSLAVEAIERACGHSEPFILVFEGAVPIGMPEACRIAGRPLADVLLPLARRAQYVVAAGTCASFGGIPSADGNLTGADSLRAFMEQSQVPVAGRLVHCPGCPCHPDDLLVTLAHLAGQGYPEVRQPALTPTMLYSHCIHDECPRVPMYNMRIFAQQFGDGEACLLQLGCQGLDAHADCQRRGWNGGVNWCIQAGAPCIACTQSRFGKSRSSPLYLKGKSTPPGQ